MEKQTFEIKDDFYLNGKPYKIISGAVHYFRVVPEYWRDRLEKLKAMGCNVVETYVPWNMHEPQKGAFCFDGFCDITGFLQIAQELGLYAIVRPGPYICAEWEFGGLPAWLLADDTMRVRQAYGPFLRHVEDYFKILLPVLEPFQIQNGGPVIMVQVENEYGYYGDDTAYMEAVRDLLLQFGIAVPLVTSDGPNGDLLACGSVQGALPTANFGSRAPEHMDKLMRHLKSVSGGPQMCMEFWVGWFDAWGDERHHTAGVETNAKDLNELLARGSVNFYMFHGGTNFGFMNGANYHNNLSPDVTSYDYDAPLSEDGRITEKYKAFREGISHYAAVPELSFSTVIKRASFGECQVDGKVSLRSTLSDISRPAESPCPLPMEKLGQNYGYTYYQTTVSKGEAVEKFRLIGANDRAIVFVDGKPVMTLYDRELLEEYEVNWRIGGGLELGILVENMGRVNFGHMMDSQRKGINGAVLMNGHSHAGWLNYPLPMDNESLDNLNYSAAWRAGVPAFYRVTLRIKEPADTFLDMTGWGKGCVLLNGFQLGRFWEKGPQKRLYIPAPLLRAGNNTLVIFETEGKANETVLFAGEPKLE